MQYLDVKNLHSTLSDIIVFQRDVNAAEITAIDALIVRIADKQLISVWQGVTGNPAGQQKAKSAAGKDLIPLQQLASQLFQKLVTGSAASQQAEQKEVPLKEQTLGQLQREEGRLIALINKFSEALRPLKDSDRNFEKISHVKRNGATLAINGRWWIINLF